jgi:hypothetical protein
MKIFMVQMSVLFMRRVVGAAHVLLLLLYERSSDVPFRIIL